MYIYTYVYIIPMEQVICTYVYIKQLMKIQFSPPHNALDSVPDIEIARSL